MQKEQLEQLAELLVTCINKSFAVHTYSSNQRSNFVAKMRFSKNVWCIIGRFWVAKLLSVPDRAVVLGALGCSPLLKSMESFWGAVPS